MGQGDDGHHSTDPWGRDPLESCCPAFGIGFQDAWRHVEGPLGSIMMVKSWDPECSMKTCWKGIVSTASTFTVTLLP